MELGDIVNHHFTWLSIETQELGREVYTQAIDIYVKALEEHKLQTGTLKGLIFQPIGEYEAAMKLRYDYALNKAVKYIESKRGGKE